MSQNPNERQNFKSHNLGTYVKGYNLALKYKNSSQIASCWVSRLAGARIWVRRYAASVSEVERAKRQRHWNVNGQTAITAECRHRSKIPT